MPEETRIEFDVTWERDNTLNSWCWNGVRTIVHVFPPRNYAPFWRAFKDEDGAWKSMKRFDGPDAETSAFQYAARLVRQKQAMERLCKLVELSDPDDEYLQALDKLTYGLKQAMGKGLDITVKLLPSVETATRTEEQEEILTGLEEIFEEPTLELVPGKEFEDADGHHTIWTVRD